MVNYSCEKCGKTFKQKGHYMKHLQRKTPCDNIKDKIEQIVEKKVDELVQEKLQDLLENGDIEIKNKNLISNNQNSNIDNPGMEGKINKLKIGTLFSGIGSFEHALNRLNIEHEIVFAGDICKYVKQSYFNNYTIKEEDWHDDITKFDANKYHNNVDIIIGGSPCQSFSSVGKQGGLDDNRGNLIFEFIRIIKESNPRVFIFENVKGLTTHDKGNTFKYVLSKFDELEYNICYDILKAADYGIPQSRQRLFLIGIRKDCENITINFPPPKKELNNIKMKDFLEDNPDIKYYMNEKGQNFAVKDFNIKKQYTQINGEIALCQKKNQQFNWHGDFIFEYREIPDKYYLSDKVKEYVLKSGTKNFNTSSTETDLDIARPIVATCHKMHRAGVDNYITKMGKLRRLTPRECLRLMGFSDNFKICVSDTRMYQQAGNSIVSNILMSIMENISFN